MKKSAKNTVKRSARRSARKIGQLFLAKLLADLFGLPRPPRAQKDRPEKRSARIGWPIFLEIKKRPTNSTGGRFFSKLLYIKLVVSPLYYNLRYIGGSPLGAPPSYLSANGLVIYYLISKNQKSKIS